MPALEGVCTPVDNLRFDQESLRSFERIKKLRLNGKWIDGLLALNSVFGIMMGKSAPGPSSGVGYAYQITQTDWQAYARAMQAAPSTMRREIEKEGERMYIRYASDNSNPSLAKFWKGVAYGCRY